MTAPTPTTPTPQATAPQNTISWTLDEFNRLAARAEDQPHRVQAAVSLFQAKLINFTMFKDLLGLLET
jgi:hypothetical protein